jgi:hypothetical protein
MGDHFRLPPGPTQSDKKSLKPLDVYTPTCYCLDMKATHYGECQVCGRRQKLPGGMLSKHGYTVQWGFFNGVCWGERNKPFEQDKGLIEGAIKRAQAEIVNAEIKAKEIRARTDLNSFYHSYETSAYVWREIVFFEAPSTVLPDRMERLFKSVDGFPLGHYKQPLLAYSRGFYGHTLAECAAEGRERYCKQVLDKFAADLSRYVAWQQDRIKNWAPKPLVAIETT